MAKVYTVNTYRRVKDAAKLAAYAELATVALRETKARVLARGMPAVTLEAGLNERVIVIEWDSVEEATALYESESYKRALAALGDGAERDIRIVPGV